MCAPKLTSINPATGPDTGGTPVLISGTNFQGGLTLTIGGNPAVINDVQPTQIGTVTPAGTELANVVVTNPAMRFDTETDGFTHS